MAQNVNSKVVGLLIAWGLWAALFLEQTHAQIDPQWFYEIEQNGKIAGVIYAPPRSAGGQEYAEHWVVFSNYVYPNGKNKVESRIRAQRKNPYASEKDFLTKYAIPPGGKYIRVNSSEFSQFPVQR